MNFPSPGPHSGPRTLAILNHRGERLSELRTGFQDRGWEVFTARDLKSSIQLLDSQDFTAAVVAPLSLRPENLEGQELFQKLSPSRPIPWLVVPWEGTPPGTVGGLLRRQRDTLANLLALPVSAAEADTRLQVLLQLGFAVAEKQAEIQRLRQMVITDELTGVYTKGHFLERLNSAFDGSQRHRHDLSVLFLDIDDFKDFNEEHGHIFADHALKTMALSLKEGRSQDLVARWGGDEFVFLLPNTGLQGAIEKAKRVLGRVQQQVVSFEGQTARIQISIGLAHFTGDDIHSGEELLRRAERAMKTVAKKSGKNQVAFWDHQVDAPMLLGDPAGD